MQKRNKEQIVADILETCQKSGAVRTRIVYQANMNFGSIRPYLDLLIRNKLLKSTPGVFMIYKTTPMGIEVLNSIREIEKTIFK